MVYSQHEYVKPLLRSKPAPQIKDLDALTTVYAALADPTRLRILSLLGDDEICVCHLHASLDVPQPTASRHLAYLRKAGLVEARRDGVWMHYRLAPIESPVVASVVKAALHALTHTASARRTSGGCRSRARRRDHRAVRLRSQCRALADRRCPVQRIREPRKARAISAGTHPAERVHPEVVTAMQARGIDLSARTRRG